MKTPLMLMACLVLAAASFAGAETVMLGGTGSPTAAATVVSDTSTETVLTFTLNGFVRDKETENGVAYDRVLMHERGTTEKIGLPELPALNLSLIHI